MSGYGINHVAIQYYEELKMNVMDLTYPIVSLIAKWNYTACKANSHKYNTRSIQILGLTTSFLPKV